MKNRKQTRKPITAAIVAAIVAAIGIWFINFYCGLTALAFTPGFTWSVTLFIAIIAAVYALAAYFSDNAGHKISAGIAFGSLGIFFAVWISSISFFHPQANRNAIEVKEISREELEEILPSLDETGRYFLADSSTALQLAARQI